MSLFFEIIGIGFAVAWNIARATWWIFTPVVLFFITRDYWLLWRRIEYGGTRSFILLEIKLPPEVQKTPKAMELVLAGLHGAWDEINWRDKWIQGKMIPTFGLELVGINGEMHFYIHAQRGLRNLVEASIYAQYPDAEIREAEDYTKDIPPDIPNREWDLWGTDMKLSKAMPYPIKTWFEFEEVEEERRTSPLSEMAEVFGKLQPGEQIWIQILARPVMGFEWREEGEQILAKHLKREKPPKIPIIGQLANKIADAISSILGGKPEPLGARKLDDFSLFKLSPGEQDVVKAVERKISKTGYLTTIRALYLGRNDVFSRMNIPALQGVFRQYATENLNSLRPDGNTLPKSSLIWFKKTRQFIRKRRLFESYKMRMLGVLSRPYVLNVEELATIYHFPGTVVTAPMMPRVPGRRGEPPRGLPME